MIRLKPLLYMTVEKDKMIKIPVWLVSILLPIVIALLTSYVAISSQTTELRVKTENNAKQIEAVQKDKVDRNEINLILQQLERIEKKLDRIE